MKKTETRSVGRPRVIGNEKLDSIVRMAKARKLTLKKVCNMQHVNYGSVLAAANALSHGVLALVKKYKPRAAKA